jgi:hypothetical protein
LRYRIQFGSSLFQPLEPALQRLVHTDMSTSLFATHLYQHIKYKQVICYLKKKKKNTEYRGSGEIKARVARNSILY